MRMISRPKSEHPSVIALSEFLRRPRAVGSAFPATVKLVERVLAPVDWSSIDVFVEFGPGTGRFTRWALQRMKPEAALLAIETGAGFVDHLRSTLKDDRLIVAHGCAQEVSHILSRHGLGEADCILSGLPFSTLPSDNACRIVEASRAVLSHSGTFAAYQMRKAVEPLLRARFRTVLTGFEWRNVPPCYLYWASGTRIDSLAR